MIRIDFGKTVGEQLPECLLVGERRLVLGRLLPVDLLQPVEVLHPIDVGDRILVAIKLHCDGCQAGVYFLLVILDGEVLCGDTGGAEP